MLTTKSSKIAGSGLTQVAVRPGLRWRSSVASFVASNAVY